MPNTLLLAPGLVVDKIYVGYWYWGRPSAYQLWLDLQDLFRRRLRPDDARGEGRWGAAQAVAV
ncbi:MAG: hypothetical protein H0U07_08460 [Actinobacteria bacterium]|nr:hypothetical protein [Actinomycetota bacterium]